MKKGNIGNEKKGGERKEMKKKGGECEGNIKERKRKVEEC